MRLLQVHNLDSIKLLLWYIFENTDARRVTRREILRLLTRTISSKVALLALD